jgi:hypothetical protein
MICPLRATGGDRDTVSFMGDWAWNDLISLGALLVSIFAIVLSVRTGRQAARYHPQPKLIEEWDGLEVAGGGLFVRLGSLHNRGDAPARDLRISVEYASTEPWQAHELLAPGEKLMLQIPVVDRMSIGEGAAGTAYNRDGDRRDYKFVTPRVTMSWRQAPFDGKPRKKLILPPKTPDMLNGETS